MAWAPTIASRSISVIPGRVKRNLTLTYGLRYVRDSGRTDSDLAAIPALNQFGAGLGNRVNQPNLNFAPQVGVAWDPGHAGKTVLRAGIGLFYENAVWNNELFDRPPRLPSGLFLIDQTVCSNGTGGAFTLPNGQVQHWAPHLRSSPSGKSPTRSPPCKRNIRQPLSPPVPPAMPPSSATRFPMELTPPAPTCSLPTT